MYAVLGATAIESPPNPFRGGITWRGGARRGAVTWAPRLGDADDDAARERARQLYDKATRAFNAGQYETAARYYNQAYNTRNHPDVLIALGEAEMRAGNLTSAEVAFEMYLRDAPDGARREQARKRLAEIRKRLGPVGPGPAAYVLLGLGALGLGYVGYNALRSR